MQQGLSASIDDHEETMEEAKHQTTAVTLKQHENIIRLPRPTGKDAKATEVYSWFEITLKEVDVPVQTFTCSVEIHLFWKDPNLPKQFPKYNENDFIVDEDYVPIKMHEIFENKVNESILSGPEFKYYDSKGVVYMFMVVECTLAERMELQRFPLDRQFLNIEFNGLIESENEGEGDWKWTLNYPQWMPTELNEFNKTFAVKMLGSITEYELLTPWVDFSVPQPPLAIELRVNRLPKFYYGNIILPNFLIVLGCFGAFTIPRTDVADRLSVTVTLMLAAVAFRFVVQEFLPKVSYLTFMDYYLLTGFVALICLVFENSFVGSKLFSNPKTADAIDYFFFYVFATMWLLVHVIVAFTGVYKEFLRIPWPAMKAIDDAKDPEAQFVFAERDCKHYKSTKHEPITDDDVVLELMKMDTQTQKEQH